MTEKHTPEPWYLEEGYAVIHQDQDRPTAQRIMRIADCASAEQGADTAEANARRIVAAINATAGIPTEALEDGAVSEAVVLLEKFASAFRLGTEWESLYPEDVYAQARAALAKLKGG